MRKNHQRIVGGMFGLELEDRTHSQAPHVLPPILTGRRLLLASARSAFALLARSLLPGTVWLPSYLCGVILEAFTALPTAARYYAVDENLRIADDNWLADVHEGDMVVFIDYFGFNLWDEWGCQAARRGAWVVEDACQAMANAVFSKYSQYVIASPRKFVGVPDGGILLAQDGASLPEAPTGSPPSQWWLEAFRASILRAEFDRHGGERIWFKLFQQTEANAPIKPARMSELSSVLLHEVINWCQVKLRRAENYRFLASAFESIALLPDLPEGVVPLGFPVKLEKRDQALSALFDAQIYPPIHWPVREVVPQSFLASHRLAEKIITIPCDQRYHQSDMERVVSCLQQARITAREP